MLKHLRAVHGMALDGGDIFADPTLLQRQKDRFRSWCLANGYPESTPFLRDPENLPREHTDYRETEIQDDHDPEELATSEGHLGATPLLTHAEAQQQEEDTNEVGIPQEHPASEDVASATTKVNCPVPGCASKKSRRDKLLEHMRRRHKMEIRAENDRTDILTQRHFQHGQFEMWYLDNDHPADTAFIPVTFDNSRTTIATTERSVRDRSFPSPEPDGHQSRNIQWLIKAINQDAYTLDDGESALPSPGLQFRQEIADRIREVGRNYVENPELWQLPEIVKHVFRDQLETLEILETQYSNLKLSNRYQDLLAAYACNVLDQWVAWLARDERCPDADFYLSMQLEMYEGLYESVEVVRKVSQEDPDTYVSTSIDNT